MKTPIDPADIDRLVDGELLEDERRILLLRLDATPDGWRTLALAFLESREFGQAAREWTRKFDAPGPTIEGPKSLRRHPHLARLGLAASIAVVLFLAGLLLGHRLADLSGIRPDSSPTAVVDPGRSPVAGVTGNPVAIPPELSWVETQPASVPEYVRSEWERRGYQIEQKRKLVTMELKDGRRVAIPYDDIRVEFVGRPIY